jgi:hypothetical protein
MASSKWQKKKGYNYTKKNEVVAIVIDWESGHQIGRSFHTQDLPQVLKKFLLDMQRLFPAATHVNLYDKQKNFIRRERLQVQLFTEQKKMLTNRKCFPMDPVTKCIFENSLY